jgi:hypothetical protein
MAATVVLARGVCDRSGADGPARQVGLGRVFVPCIPSPPDREDEARKEYIALSITCAATPDLFYSGEGMQSATKTT